MQTAWLVRVWRVNRKGNTMNRDYRDWIEPEPMSDEQAEAMEAKELDRMQERMDREE